MLVTVLRYAGADILLVLRYVGMLRYAGAEMCWC